MHCLSPLQVEVKSEELFSNSWEKKTGVKLEGRWSSLLPKRLVPLISPITQGVRWWWYQAWDSIYISAVPTPYLHFVWRGMGEGNMKGQVDFQLLSMEILLQ